MTHLKEARDDDESGLHTETDENGEVIKHHINTEEIAQAKHESKSQPQDFGLQLHV